MSIKELGEKLKEMYNNAPAGDAVAMIHLFGIKYAEPISKSGYSKKILPMQPEFRNLMQRR